MTGPTTIATTLTVFALVMGGLVAQQALGAEPAGAGQAESMAVARGAQAWGNNCTRCHNLRVPNELRDDQWRPVVTHMRIRAGLTGGEARDILTFLQSSN